METIDKKIEKFIHHAPASNCSDSLALGVWRKNRNTKITQYVKAWFNFTSKPATKVIFLVLTQIDFESLIEADILTLRYFSHESLTINLLLSDKLGLLP